MKHGSVLLALFMLTAATGATHAQDTRQQHAGCVDLSEPGLETEPARGPDSGTAPGGAGSTGWTGGLGGSDIGTSQQDEKTSSPTQHPAVASGLDPIAGTTEGNGPGMQNHGKAPDQAQETATSAPC